MQFALNTLYLAIDVEEALWAVDVVEGGEGVDSTVDGHGVGAKLTACRQEEPVRVRAAHKHSVVVSNVAEITQPSSSALVQVIFHLHLKSKK